MGPDETNISIRTTKRFKAWFEVRANQENLTVSKLGWMLIHRWVVAGAPMLTEGMNAIPIEYEEGVAWEKMAPKKDTMQPRTARQPSPGFSKRK